MEEQNAEPYFDIWAIGIILYKMMAGIEPYTNTNDINRKKDIEKKRHEKLPRFYSKNLRSLVDYILSDYKKLNIKTILEKTKKLENSI